MPGPFLISENDSLKDYFVLKIPHGYGTHVVVRDKFDPQYLVDESTLVGIGRNLLPCACSDFSLVTRVISL